MKYYIKGNYRKSIFSSPKGYVIGIFKVRETNDERLVDYVNKTITFTGYFHELNEDDNYIFYGEGIDHPKYGFQFQVSEYERIKPEDKDGVIEFLCSDLFPGIGEKQAKTIVEVLGEKALDKILEDEFCLAMVPRLSTKKAKKIYETLTKYEESHKTIVYLTELGFSMKDALNIYNTYKSYTIEYIEHDIYRLMDEVEDISFLKLDEIARKKEIDPMDERRVKACILYHMRTMTWKQGDTYLLREEIYQPVCSYLHQEIGSELFETLVNALVDEEKIYIDHDEYYVMDIYEAEVEIARRIQFLNHLEPLKYKKLNGMLEAYEKVCGFDYNKKQKEAIKEALTNHCFIITGGPGTGKTTIIKAIIDLYQKLNDLNYDQLVEEICLLAPTGRASKRMSEATLLPASTIHRFLKWNKETNEFGVNEFHKDQSKFIIIDEVSMIDISLLDSLLKGLPDHIQLIFVGDFNQLPSVGPGQILKDFIESEEIPMVHLDLLYRQDEDSYITTLAHEIKDNQLSDNYLKTKSDYTFLTCSGDSIRKNLKTVCKQVLDKGYTDKQVQVMAPMYRGMNGIDNLNKELQEVFNPPSPDKKEITYGDVIFREHDKILQLINMPEENVFNGDIGTISKIVLDMESPSKKKEIYVDYDGLIVKYQPKDFIHIKHGFIITIHKSQGSEFPIVIMPVSMTYHRMLYRKLIYTGITRAKKKLILLGEPNAFLESVQNNHERKRKTSLLRRLKSSE
ncbi:MAG: ATP-dependent RecD-like DNA helicase [Firmicutes bacterium]|nr:ATP-dependent RecD-like DNA helicase [Bacillota bacterium]